MAAAPVNLRPQPWKPPAGPLQAYTREDLAMVYLRQMKTAVVTLAVIAVLGVIASVIIGIVLANNVSNQNSNSGVSPCMSQGGTIPGC